MSGARILVVDDDPAILREVRTLLQARNYDVKTLDVGREVLTIAGSFRPNVILLDLMLPDADGLELCSELRPSTGAAIIILSAAGDEAKKVQALDLGADDYITKPFGTEELLARIRVALRREAANSAAPILTAGAIRISLDSRVVTAHGTVVHLTPTEFDLLRLLVEEQDRVLTQRVILARVWGAEYVEDSHILRTFIHQLRQKLSAVAPDAADLIVTDPGVGYRLVVPES